MKNLNEGINFKSNIFEFDFKTNSEQCIIEFDTLPLTKIDIDFDNENNNENIFYIGYEFTSNTDSKTRTKFFHELRFNDNFTSKENKLNFVESALRKLTQQVKFSDINLVIFPQSRSSLNQIILKLIYKLTNKQFTKFELIKNLTNSIEFDWENFIENELNSFVNGKQRYTENQKVEQITNINNILTNIKNSNYFSIAESVKRNKYKIYFRKYLKFKNEEQEKLFTQLSQNEKSILLIDDVTTTGSTIYQCLKVLKFLNPKINIIIFTLIGKKEIKI